MLNAGRVERNALVKLTAKNLDMIAANQVGEGLAFDKDENALTVYWHGGKQELTLTSKAALARQLVEVIAQRYRNRDQNRSCVAEGSQTLSVLNGSR